MLRRPTAVNLILYKALPNILLLGQVFNISESYANKIYHKISNIIIKTAHVKGFKSVAEGNIKDIVIDVCEQQIERPKKGQKDYYSGKKTTYK